MKDQTSETLRIFKGDQWTRLYGSRVPIGTIIRVIKFYPCRRVMIEYQGEPILTMLWCLSKNYFRKRPKPLDKQQKESYT